MTQSYDLTQLDANSFEHLVNFLSLKVLGNGVTGFATGPDGGRDGYLQGKASYPTEQECWAGVWFIQSKFHKPHLSKDPQKWLVEQISNEIEQFEMGNRSSTPDNWIIATNIEPSGVSQTGAFDKILKLVREFNPNINFDIWGGRKIIDLLHGDLDAASAYGHFLTPGHVITELYSMLKNKNKELQSVIDHLIVNQFLELSYTKLEQAGSVNDNRPKIYELFKDLPISATDDQEPYFIMESLVSASSNVQKISIWDKFGEGWKKWTKNPKRARVTLLKGGPGQGKSTAGQYFSQIQRAAFILSENGPKVSPQIKEIANELKQQAIEQGFWPTVPRVTLFVELKDFANWYIKKDTHEPKNVIAYICYKIKIKTSMNVTAEMIHEALTLYTWFVNFDGLDEVPNDVKDEVAYEITTFTNELIPRLDADVLVLCTTRPQGYSGQFDTLFASNVILIPLPDDIALECASAVVKFNRDIEESDNSISILKSAMESEQVRELMTTPLQSHIMAVVVRDGGRPPEKRWELFNNFYSVMKKRESLKNFPDMRITGLLREQEQLLKSIHDRLGVCLHAKAEISSGAEATLNKSEFKSLAYQTVKMQFDTDIDQTVDILMEATTERLVFVNTPESSDSVRFDIRQLQEFFAAEFIYNAVDNNELQSRIEIIGGDAHWREVVHFLLSALTHHKRLSELAVAVTIIQQLDDDDQNHQIRSFRKRMGIGSLFALRLLEEGMLEQDKRIRQQFKKSLTPLWGMLDFETLHKITSVKKEHSKAWLINNMINDFIELDFSEHFSLGYLLSILLEKDHLRFNEVKVRLTDAPTHYLISTLKIHCNQIKNKETKEAQPWFIQLAIKYIFCNNENNTPIQKAAINYIYNIKKYVRGVIKSLNLTPEREYLISVLAEESNSDLSEIKKAQRPNPYSFFMVHIRNDNWFNCSERKIFPKIEITSTDWSPSLNLLISIIKFHLVSNSENFKNFIKSLENNGFDSYIVPMYVKALLPINIESEKIKEVSKMILNFTDEQTDDYLCSCKEEVYKIPAYVEHFTWDDSAFDSLKWKNLCFDFPDIALRLWSGSISGHSDIKKVKEENPEEFNRPILDLVFRNPELFTQYFLSWKVLFDFYPQYELEIRKLMNLCQTNKMSNNLSNMREKSIPFIIDVENEKKFINFLACSIFYVTPMNAYVKGVNVRRSLGNFNESMLNDFGITNSFLIDKCIDVNESILFRASCLSCYLSQIFKDKKEAKRYIFEKRIDKVFLSLICDDTKDLLSNALFVFCYDMQIYDEDLMELIGAYSLLIKDDFINRSKIQNIYQRFRERSFAPVNSNSLLDKWLNYSY